MTNPQTIEIFIASLPRQEANYAAAFAHWATSGQSESTLDETESRRVGIRQARAASIRRQIEAIIAGVR